MPDSVHTGRWVRQLDRDQWDVHLFPAYRADLHPYLKDVTAHNILRQPLHERIVRKIKNIGLHDYDGIALAQTIRRIKPDIVHSLEMTKAGYLVLRAFNLLRTNLPPWIVSCWGSDLFLFARLDDYEPQLRAILNRCDFFLSDCERDGFLARQYGFEKTILPVLPAGGGCDVVVRLNQISPSKRKIIALKGYQGVMGRSLFGIAALRLNADLIRQRNFRVVIYSAHAPEVRAAAELLSKSSNVSVKLMPKSSHEDMLRLFGESRMVVGISISDGMPYSVLEAMLMGAFPVQSDSFAMPTWFENRKNGLLVSPEDPQNIAKEIQNGLLDDSLVDEAAKENIKIIQQRYDQSQIRAQANEMYRTIAPSRRV